MSADDRYQGISDAVGVSTTETPSAKEPAVKESESAVEETADEITRDESETSEEIEEADASDESQDDSDDDESQDNEEVQEQKPKKNGFKKRIDKLAKAKAEAESQAAYWREQALKGQSQKTEQQLAVEVKALNAPVDGAPQVENFETYSEYIDALTDWKIEAREKARESKAQEVQQKVEFEKAQETFTQRAKDFAANKPDWNERIAGISHMPFNQELAKVIHVSENGPEILYNLMGDDDTFERINSLSGAALGREIGKLEARFESSKAAPKPQAQQKTKAPPPIKPVTGKSPAAVKKSPNEMDYDEYKTWRQEQTKKR